MARKFSVRRALELYETHQNTRIQEGLYNIDPMTEPVKSELLSGKFTVLVLKTTISNFIYAVL